MEDRRRRAERRKPRAVAARHHAHEVLHLGDGIDPLDVNYIAYSGGCTTSSLQSSAMGERIYDTLGYRRWFRLHMYERRSAA